MEFDSFIMGPYFQSAMGQADKAVNLVIVRYWWHSRIYGREAELERVFMEILHLDHVVLIRYYHWSEAGSYSAVQNVKTILTLIRPWFVFRKLNVSVCVNNIKCIFAGYVCGW